MAIYIAVCDDNIADRKQLERLLGREALKRGREGTPVYVDSFGSSESLLKTPNRYDLFLIDITQEGDTACFQTASYIKGNGIDSVIVIICSKIDHRIMFSDSDMHLLFRDQPLLQNDISELVDLAIENAADRTPVIEVRCQNETRFLKPEEFLYAQAKDKISQIEINLFDGGVIMSTETIDQFSSNLALFNDIVRFGLCYVNLSHVSRLSARSVIFDNGAKLPLSLKDFLLLRKLCR
ncbi:MAG: hypothetical protein K5770_10620 [Lachnospiraceae bacterium]|nr:hypothetical protein [Lachnospiraceae bacterium]